MVKKDFKEFSDPAVKKDFKEFNDPVVKKDFKEFRDPVVKKDFKEFNDPVVKKDFKEFNDPIVKRDFRSFQDDKEAFDEYQKTGKKKLAGFQKEVDSLKFLGGVGGIVDALRKDRFKEAKSQFFKLIASDVDPQFRSGWLTRHLGKKLDVKGFQPLGKDLNIKAVAADPSAPFSIVVTRNNGRDKTRVWKTTRDGETADLQIELPETEAEIRNAALSSDGNYLAISLDDVPEDGDHLWIVNLQSKQLLKDSSNEEDYVIGCSEVEFSKVGNRIFTVEELDGYRGLKQRVQIVERSIAGNSTSVVNEQTRMVDATTPDEGRVKYLADIRLGSSENQVVIAYQTLTVEKKNIEQLEVISLGVEDSESAKVQTLKEFPTALHLADDGKLFLGFSNGRLEQHSAQQIASEGVEVNQDRSSNDRIVKIDSSVDGDLILGLSKGALKVWDIAAEQPKFVKQLSGQPGQLTALKLGKKDPENGVVIFTGDEAGHIGIQEPATSKHDAFVRKESSSTNVTCGAVDGNRTQSDYPAAAYGTSNGSVYYFDSQKMQEINNGIEVGRLEGLNASLLDDSSPKFKISSPFETFGLAFDDFDAMGIVGEQFVLIKSDGTFYHTLIDGASTEPSLKSNSYDLLKGRGVDTNFVPLIASQHDKDYFFTSNPTDSAQLVWWKRLGNRFKARRIAKSFQVDGTIKRMTMSPDGRWLGLVREVNNISGEYRVEFYSIDDGETGRLSFSNASKEYPVGDPAFIEFSEGSDRLVVNEHMSDVYRRTLVRNWQLNGNRWNLSRVDGKNFVSDTQIVDVVGWNGGVDLDRLVTRANRKFYLAKARPLSQGVASVSAPSFPRMTKSVRPKGAGSKFYVLHSNRLEEFDDITPTGNSLKFGPDKSETYSFLNARDIRVFGEQAVVLDDRGFHLVNSKMEYVTKLANRKSSVIALSLSRGRLATIYGAQGGKTGKCVIRNVEGERPEVLGSIDDVGTVELSADGKWAACLKESELLIYDVTSPFEGEKSKRAIARNSAIQWIGGDSPSLLIAQPDEANLAATIWLRIKPENNKVLELDLKLPTKPSLFKGPIDFALAPVTEKYLAINSETGVSLWAISKTEDPVDLSGEEIGFKIAAQEIARSISFSEIVDGETKLSEDEKKQVATRFVTLSENQAEGLEEMRIFLLASKESDVEAAGEGEAAAGAETAYKVREIEGVLENDGRNLIDVEFSGDSRTLFQVDDKGVKALLSK